jgi:hypothetical protein
VGTKKWPVITFRYTHGFQGIFGSDFNYDKLRINIDKRIKLGPFGVGLLTITGEKIFNTLPYPLLAVHLGNGSPIYSQFTYNLMNYGEFISDEYVSLRYRQFLEGFLINRIPLIKKLDLRLVGTANIIEGQLSQANKNSISEYTLNGSQAARTGYFTGKPYVELGYGVENILHFIRIDFVHRLSYLDPKEDPISKSLIVPRRFGVLFTVQFKL